jgi:rubrerythrin
MLHKMPIKMHLQNDQDNDEQILRSAIIAEFDAINLYEQMANSANNQEIKTILLDVAKEEKVHVGEFEKLLNILDFQHQESTIVGEEEVEEKLHD